MNTTKIRVPLRTPQKFELHTGGDGATPAVVPLPPSFPCGRPIPAANPLLQNLGFEGLAGGGRAMAGERWKRMRGRIGGRGGRGRMGEGEEGRRTDRRRRRRLLQGSREREEVVQRTSEQVRGVGAAGRFRAFPSSSARKPCARGGRAWVDRLELGQLFQAQILYHPKQQNLAWQFQIANSKQFFLHPNRV